jgi:hypothetical protein
MCCSSNWTSSCKWIMGCKWCSKRWCTWWTWL